MRKVLSFVLVLAMVLGSVAMAFAATPSDVVGKNCEDAVNSLIELGVVNGYTDGTYKPEGIVTRAEMAKLIISALGLDPKAGNAVFTDCKGHWAEAYIAYANSLGIIKGRTASIFDPDATVSYDEALTMLVRALGYTDESLTGTYPAAYTSQARALGICDTVKTVGSTGANRGDVACLLYDTLNCNIGTVDNDNKWNATVGGDTMMKRLMKVTKDNDEYYMIITRSDINDAKTDIAEYLGAYVKAYVKDNKIVAISEVLSKNYDLEWKKSDGKWYIDGKEVKFDTPLNDTFSWKNHPSGSNTDANNWGYAPVANDIARYTTDGDVGNATGICGTTSASAIGAGFGADKTIQITGEVSGNYIKNVYAVINWDAEETVKVTQDLVNEIKNDDTFNSVKFPMTDDDKVDTKKVAILGVSDLSEIKKDDIVTYYVNSEGKITKIAVSDKVVSGKVTKISGANLTVGGSTYKNATGSQATGTLATYKAGDSYDLRLNYAGKVAWSKKTSGSADTYGIVLAIKNGSTGALGTTPQVQMVLADGSAKTFSVNADDASDGNIAGITKAGVALNWIAAPGDIVKYGLDENGKINAMDVKAATVSPKKDVSSNGYYDSHKIDADAIIINYNDSDANTTVSALGTKTKYYTAGTYAGLVGTEKVEAKYVINNDSKAIEFMIVGGGDTGTATYAIYGSSKYTGENNAYGVSMILVGESAKKDYNTTQTIYNNAGGTGLSTGGGVYKLSFNTSGNISSFNAVNGGVNKTTWNSITFTSTQKSIKFSDNVLTMVSGAAPTLGHGSVMLIVNATTEKAVQLAENYSVYKLNNEKKWEKVAISKITFSSPNAEKDLNGHKIEFVDCLLNDGICDTVLVY